MKKILTAFFVFCLMAISYSNVSATSIPGGPFQSSINLQNVGVGIAQVTIQYVDKSGNVVFTSSHDIQPGDVLSIYVPSVNGLASGEYSVVISSTEEIAAISNFKDGDSHSSYIGAAEGNATWFVPGVYRDYYKNYSEIYAQNISGNTQDITLEVFAPGSSVPIYTNKATGVANLKSVNWGLENVAAMQRNIAYSAKVTSSGSVVVMTNYYGTGDIAPQLYSYNGFTSGALKYFAPVLTNNYYGWNSSISLQNVSANTANATVAFSANGVSKAYSIAPNSSVSIYVPAVEGLPAGSGGLFGATISADQNIAVVVNQSNGFNRGASYTAVSQPTQKVVVPILLKRYYNESSSLTCQNVGGADTIMNVKYSGLAASRVSAPIRPGDIWSLYLPADPAIPDKYLGSAVITADQNIACVVQSNFEDAPYKTQNIDALKSYTGINRSK